MIVNGRSLLRCHPLTPMFDKKHLEHGVSYGLGEAGYDVRIKQGVWLNSKKRFALASTVERFTMPTHLVGVVHDKSTWARKGLSVFNTVIEPGWEGFLTLELVYHGDEELVISPNAGIAQVLFHALLEDADYGEGKYQGQPDQPVNAKFEG